MRKIVAFITLLTLAGLLGLAVPTRLSAQGGCTPDCFSTPFGMNQTITLQLPGGCWVKIVYASRNVCNNYYDVSRVHFKLPKPIGPVLIQDTAIRLGSRIV